LAALLFLYREVLALDLPWMENVVRAKRAPRLPVVLSRAEAMALLHAMSGREALMAGLLYGSGLRLMECLRLRMKDVDLARNEITVREGKGGKDRKTVLPARLRPALQAQMDSARAHMSAIWKPDTGRFPFLTRWPASTAARKRNRVGSMCSLPLAGQWTLPTDGRSDITWTKACCSARCVPLPGRPASPNPSVRIL
jgi:integrase